MTPLTPYQLRLFVFLSVATFFEGYDFFALAQILPNLRHDLGVERAMAGPLLSFINTGAILAYLLVRLGDRWGRRRVLTLTITGYTSFSLLSGLAPNVWVFAGAQLLARTFLVAEWAVAMVYAAEEYPADRRGMVIGVIQACASLGAIACAGLVPLLLRMPWGWRTVYFIGAIPLVIIAVARRNLRETARFAERAREIREEAPSILRILRSPYRGRVLQMALIWALTYVCTQNAIAFWKEFAMGERGLNDAQVAGAMTIAAVVSMPLLFLSGKFIDLVGRRMGAAVIFTLTAVGVGGAYTLYSRAGLVLALILGIFGVSAVLPVLNAYTAELFPTELRSDAFAWANNLLGRLGGVLSPLLLGPLIGSYGFGMVALTALFPLLALGLILHGLPETRGRELEETCLIH